MNRICRTEKHEEASRGGTGELPTKPVATIPQSAFRVPQSRASALITTLLVLVVLSTIVVAFMQSMSIERSVAQSQTNVERAKLASEAGLSSAVKQLEIGMGKNQAYLVGLTNDSLSYGPVTVIGVTNLTDISQMMPLISGDLSTLTGFPSPGLSNAVTSYLNARANAASTDAINLNIRNQLIQQTNNTNSFRAPWVYIVDSEGKTNARFAYMVFDEYARVNPRYHFGTNRDNSTNWFSGSEVLPLSTGGSNLLSGSEATNTRAVTNQLISLHEIGQSFANRAAYEAKKHLLSVNQAWSPDVIPRGYYSNTTFVAFADAGKPKYNINDLATNIAYGTNSSNRAVNIANIISSNLPAFGKRDAGLQTEDPTGQKYVNRVAAAIVDYIDNDAIPTHVNNGEPAGKELTPFVTLVAEKNIWLSEAAGSGTAWSIQVESQFFVQLWNPYTVPVQGDVRLEVLNRQFVDLPEGGTQSDFSDYIPTSVSVSLQPNEFKAVEFIPVQQTFQNFLNRPSSTAARYPRWPQTSSSGASLVGHPQFRFYFGGVLTDMNRSEPIMAPPASAGLPRGVYTFPSLGAIRWSFSFLPSNIPNTVADPRITYLCQSDWQSANNIALAFWQGRQNNTAGRTQNLVTAWGSRDFVRANSSNFGTALSASNASPVTIPTQYSINDAATAPAYIRNAPMQSIGELGHIFDPVQRNDTGGNAFGGNPGTYNRPGGGFSLRIGQPEFIPFATNGSRAIELIDLLTINTTNSQSGGYPVARPRINVNTAPQPVLEALFYNIKVTSDSSSTNSMIDMADASLLAQQVITNRPYNRLSDLYIITPELASATNFSPSLGVGNQPANALSAYPGASVFDRAREEAFGKMVELATVQSRAFRVYVVGQALGPNLKLRGQAVLEVSLSVQTNSAGNLVPIVSGKRWEN